MKHLREHPLLYILLPMCVVAIVVSFFRFMVVADYVVEYEGECDPITESCFVGCADDECLEEYYYTWIHKNAADVFAQCGPDVTDCEEAGICLPTDTGCSITYCSENTSLEDEQCENLDSSSVLEATSETEAVGEESGTIEEPAEGAVENEDLTPLLKESL